MKRVNGQKLVILDMGGVLVDLNCPAKSMGIDMTEAAFWDIWTSSDTVREYEVGRLTTKRFCQQFAREIDLNVDEFVNGFNRWTLPPYGGVEKYLVTLRQRETVVLLSNTNEHHWRQVSRASIAFALFDRIFLSFQTGHLKPSREAFEDVLHYYKVPPSNTYFFDDTGISVHAAEDLGIVAHVVSGFDSLKTSIDKLALQPSFG